MKRTDLLFAGGGVPYSAPELTVVPVCVEQGFSASQPRGYIAPDMNIENEDEW